MTGNPKFDEIIRRMQVIHEKKAHDYASDADRYSNFAYAAAVAAPFTDPMDKVFAVMIGTKLARLAELRGKGKDALNESVADTQLDLAVYATLWASRDVVLDTTKDLVRDEIRTPLTPFGQALIQKAKSIEQEVAEARQRVAREAHDARVQADRDLARQYDGGPSSPLKMALKNLDNDRDDRVFPIGPAGAFTPHLSED